MEKFDTTQQEIIDNATIYQISLRAFTPEGTLGAATKMLPFLAELGPRYIQLTPVVLADDGEDQAYWSVRQKASETDNPKNTYRIKDFFSVDPEYGTDKDLEDFVHTAHRVGLRVILDLVYFHCGPNAIFLEEHPDFVLRNADNSMNTGQWNFPRLNFDNPELREYLWTNMEYFVNKFNIDGYRCDVGDEVPLDFWIEGIRRVRSIKADFFMLNEGHKIEYFSVFDANYFYDGWSDAIKTSQGLLPASSFQENWETWHRTLPSNGKMLRFIDNHDIASDSYENRHEIAIGSAAVETLLVLDFTLDGIPFVFCGYEVADELKHNMFANRFYGKDPSVNWANALCEKGQKRIAFIKSLFKLRKESLALYRGSVTWLKHSAPEQALVYLREEAESSVFIAVNLTSSSARIILKDAPKHIDLIIPTLTQNATWTFNENEMHIDLLGYGYLVASY